MRTTKLWMATAVVAVMVAGSLAYRLAANTPDQKPDPVPEKIAAEPLRKAMLENARAVLSQNLKRYQAGVGGMEPETLYLWSSRCLEAELDLAGDAAGRKAALKAHLDRMKEAERMAAAMWKAGQGREADVAAARYYQAQAELWLTTRMR